MFDIEIGLNPKYRLPNPEPDLTGCGKNLFYRLLKRFRYKAPEIPRNEAYIEVRRNDEG
jgi:hypothetical protein